MVNSGFVGLLVVVVCVWCSNGGVVGLAAVVARLGFWLYKVVVAWRGERERE